MLCRIEHVLRSFAVPKPHLLLVKPGASLK